MKYIVFAIASVIGVPVLAFAAFTFEKLRGLLLSILIFSTVLGVKASINFLSMENYRGPDRGFEITLTDLIALALVIAMIIKFSSKIKWIPYNSTLLLLFFVIALISSLFSEEKMFSLFTLFKLIRLYLLYWCIVNSLVTGVSEKYIWNGFIAIGLYISVIAVKQKYLDGLYRINGPFDHSNTIPAYLNMIIPCVLIWGLSDKKFNSFKVLLSVLTVMGMVFAVFATQSRAGLLLSVFCVISMLFVAELRTRSKRSLITAIVVIGGLLIGGVKASDTVINRFLNAPKESQEAREEFNLAAIKMSNDNIFGVGLNNFSHILTENDKYSEHIKVMASEEQGGVVHHFYLLTSAEMGYPALVVFLLIIIRFMWLFLRAGWRSRSVEGLILIGLLTGVFALHMTGFLEWVLRITPVSYQFVICSGFGVALSYKLKSVKVNPEISK